MLLLCLFFPLTTLTSSSPLALAAPWIHFPDSPFIDLGLTNLKRSSALLSVPWHLHLDPATLSSVSFTFDNPFPLSDLCNAIPAELATCQNVTVTTDRTGTDAITLDNVPGTITTNLAEVVNGVATYHPDSGAVLQFYLTFLECSATMVFEERVQIAQFAIGDEYNMVVTRDGGEKGGRELSGL